VKTLYTNEVREFIKTRDWPVKVKWTVTESEFPEPHLWILFYRDNWITLSREDQWKTTEVVKEIMAHLWQDGIPTYVDKME
jgi:hypothetical protein